MRPSLISKVRPSSLISCRPKQPPGQLSVLVSHIPQRAASIAQRQPLQPLTRRLTTTTARPIAMNSSQQPRFSADSDADALETFLSPLLTANGGRWTLAMAGEALEREFKFKTFAKTWDFMTAVSLQCKLKNHHPEWSNVFNTTFIRWTTHHPKGLSSKDIELATLCDKLAADFGEVAVEKPQEQGEQQQEQQQQQQQQGEACSLSGLANRAVGSAGDCCVPKGLKK